MWIEGNIVVFFPHNKLRETTVSQKALTSWGFEVRHWDFLGRGKDADITHKYVLLGPVLQHSLFTLLAVTLFFLFMYCFMLFITMSFTFQTKAVTRNRHTAPEKSRGRVSVPWPSYPTVTNNFDPFPQHYPSATMDKTESNHKTSQDYYIISSINIISTS